MNYKYIFSLIFYLAWGEATSQFYNSETPLAHTYSIVAIDHRSGEMAVGVQSHWFSVGTLVSWGESGVGVVATQSFVNKSFGIRGLALLKEGKTPEEALKILLEEDEAREVRQVSILDTRGRVATHTGEKCISYAGHKVGENYSVQANMMLSDKVWPAMAKAFEDHEDLSLPERILETLKAGERAGGDIRGKQSAAILVVKKEEVVNPWDDPKIDLRIADHKEPLKELDRLLRVYRAYEHMNKGDLAIEQNNMKLALEEYEAAEAMFPGNLEMKYWKAVTLANNGRLEEAREILKDVFSKDENWRELTKRLPEVGLLNVEKDELRKILDL